MTLREALDALDAGDADGVAVILHGCGIRYHGLGLRAHTCPVAQFVGKALGKYVTVGDMCTVHGARMLQQHLPTAVLEFVRAFDVGAYPELVVKV